VIFVQNFAAVITSMMGKVCRFTDFHETKIGKPKLLPLVCKQCVLAVEWTPLGSQPLVLLCV